MKQRGAKQNRNLFVIVLAMLTVGVTTACKAGGAREQKSLQFAQALMREVLPDMAISLEQQVAQNGAAAAVPFCNRFAGLYGKAKNEKWSAKAATELGAKSFKFSRISARYRNPKNAPNEVQARILDSWEKGTVKPAFYEESGKLYTMHPIKIAQPLCLSCHGNATDVDAKTAAEINRLYPQDKATGYKLGDLRGAFVTEMELNQ